MFMNIVGASFELRLELTDPRFRQETIAGQAVYPNTQESFDAAR